MSFVTAAMWVGAALAAAGTAASAYGNSKATRQANSILTTALAESGKNTDKVQDELLKALPEFETDSRVKAQEELAEQTKDNVGTAVSDAQIVRNSEKGTTGDVSSDYETSRAKQNAQSLEDIRNLAQMMGNVTSAQRLRQQEGFNVADLTNRINLLNNFNNGNNRVAQLRAQAAANGQQGWKVGGQLAGALGSALMMGAGLAAAAPATAATTGVETGLGATSVANGITPAASEAIGGGVLTPAASSAYASGLLAPAVAKTMAAPRVAATSGGISKFFTGVPALLGWRK